MSSGLQLLVAQLASEHAAVLRDYLGGSGEAALKRAYELGRKALAEGLGVLQVVRLFHQALVDISPRPVSRTAWVRAITAAERVLVESLTPFEMTHRGFQETNVALRASEARYRELFENASDMAFTTDLAGNFTSMNRAGERLSGYARAELLAMNFSAVVPPRHPENVRPASDMTRSGEEESARIELEMVTKDGRRIPLEASMRLIHSGGRPIGIQGIARDATSRKQSEQAMRMVNERLEERIKRIAHALHDEAGQLLVQVHLALAEIASELPPEHRNGIARVSPLLDQAAEQLRRLAHELRPVILDDLGLLPAFEFIADGVSKRTGLIISVEGSLEERLAPAVETALYRILQEGLTNVGKHARATHVSVALRREHEKVTFTIRDDGVGVDECARAADRPCLGLLGIRERLSALGGALSIITGRGRGTTLSMTIPVE